ncbi:hypothetical protein GCM10009122_33150 [Fulvivirga kasyanovii]|uniref:7-cyano-7-deazaguanine synthase n=1 Tax=Fulvivirga kasyanovii TaxID=396812 RepID=A0ABW9RUB6_9BACT|nr:Qat anti-phage system QueC-like protein QatC [Fulvivirga kasyanovii]MBT31790.1 hypothetical protein [Thalassovita sp.]MTI27817.1 hypothetical protein [Fulvivirga kasyanovii]HNP17029.1 7-cyano-7-deazaguanine synthase [Fulvivirga sp.]
MIAFNIIFRDGAEDKFTVSESTHEKNIFIPAEDAHQSDKTLSENIYRIFEQKKLTPSDEALELLNAAVSVYTADQLVSRDTYGFDNWSRYFKLYLPVVDHEKWQTALEDLQNALNFLTGDYWEIFLRKRSAKEKNDNAHVVKTVSKVSLLSGGLDSFIGVTDLLAEGNDIAVVGHHKSQGYENSAQESLIQTLRKEYSDKHIEEFLFNAQPVQKHNKYGKESSSRARSILFIGLGIAVASAYGNEIPLYIPENGLISLNIPLTSSRIGSSSTRTTHPHFLNTLGKVLKTIGVGNEIINPYQFLTKGEMIKNSKNRALIEKYYNETVSCAHPNAVHINIARKNDEKHCGYCTPCIIRRAALKHANLDRDDHYVFKINQTQPPYTDDIGRDYRAFQMALSRLKNNKPNLSFHVLRSGPLPNKKIDLSKYIGIYDRGMKEVDNFLNAQS